MIGLLLREIRIEHTLFALPFAYVGAVIGAHGHPSLVQLVWVTLAVLGARTAGMAANRLFDRSIDARNPRTAKRASATGALSANVLTAAIVLGLSLTLIAAWQLNPRCLLLFPLAVAGLLLYPFCKRFTWGTHFVLGAVDGFAPLGAFVGVSGTMTPEALLLFLAVTVWVAGFDILYALMDLQVDREQGLFSVPSRLGERTANLAPMVLHGLMTVCLFLVGILAHATLYYGFGILAALSLIFYERRCIMNIKNIFALNDQVFYANMGFSVCFLVGTIAGFSLKR